jgi:hypothetical protein
VRTRIPAEEVWRAVLAVPSLVKPVNVEAVKERIANTLRSHGFPGMAWLFSPRYHQRLKVKKGRGQRRNRRNRKSFATP